MDLLLEALRSAVSGGLAGSGVGAVLGITACLANTVLFEQKEVLQYCHKGQWVQFRDMESIEDTKILEDIKAMQAYRSAFPSAFDQACRIVQHLVDVYRKFGQVRQQGADGLKYIAKFEAAAMKADACWRGLCYAVKDTGDQIGSEEITTAMMNIHFTLESLLAEMREVFRQNPQLEGAASKSPLAKATAAVAHSL